MKNLLFLCLSLCPMFLFSQNTYRGKILDLKTGKGLAYVNIGVVGENVGTVSAPDGSFRLRLSSDLDAAELKVSMVGYECRSFKVGEFKRKIETDPEVLLNPAIFDLQEVVVMPKFTKTKVLGNKTTSTKMTDGFSGDALGREGGAIIKLRKRYRPARVLSFRGSIARNDYDSIKFRLNFYSIKDGLPDQKLVEKNIIINSTVKKGVVEVNLEKYNILLKDDFAVTLEWIEDFGNKKLLFSMGLLGSKTVYRYTSQANWEKYNFVGPGITVTIGY